MLEAEVLGYLQTLSMEELEALHKRINARIEENKTRFKEPPRNTADVNSIAESQGLDLSGLVREISRITR
jgi:hypothetical protein